MLLNANPVPSSSTMILTGPYSLDPNPLLDDADNRPPAQLAEAIHRVTSGHSRPPFGVTQQRLRHAATACAASSPTSALSGTTATHSFGRCREPVSRTASTGSTPAGASARVCRHHSPSRITACHLLSTCAGTSPYRSPLIRSPHELGTRLQSKPADWKNAATSCSAPAPLAG